MIIRTKRPEKNTEVIMEGHAGGHEYSVVKNTILKDSKPYIYRMGEVHYSRMRACDWERELLKMKQGGIDVIASYVLWNHHEREEGVFDFSGSCDIRRFVDICEKLELPFFLRIGPWAHGEARYGGFPDWLMKKDCRLRCCDPEYLGYVRRMFEQVYEQLRTSNNIIGIQVENELSDNAEYMQTLYDMLHEVGFTAPLWSATAWHSADLPDCLLPMFGGYPDAPWAEHTHKLDPNANFFFSRVREDHVIGADLMGKGESKPKTEQRVEKYPYLTCELGGGNQNTYHRRPVFVPGDISAMAVCKLGSGANGLGYYMYHGGVNPVGRDADGGLVTFQESRVTGYPNDCPIISYDFQAPLGDCGQVNGSYYALRDIHDFIEAAGEGLAATEAFFPDTMPDDLADTVTPRVAVRSDGERGYVFYNNHVHAGEMAEKHTELTIETESGSVEIPLCLPANASGIFPFNFRIGSERVRWVTAMPVLCSAERVEFVALEGVEPQACFENGELKPLAEVGNIGGAEVILRKNEEHKVPGLAEVKCEQKPNVLSFEAFEHLTVPGGRRLADHTAEFELSVPDGTETLSVRVLGNVAAAYSMEEVPRLVSDHFCDGDNWYIDVRGVSLLRLKLQPLCEEDRGTIYFENEMPEGIVEPRVYVFR